MVQALSPVPSRRAHAGHLAPLPPAQEHAYLGAWLADTEEFEPVLTAQPFAPGARWSPPAMGEARVNLGGEGERRGYINVNPFEEGACRRSIDWVLRSDPSGAVIVAPAHQSGLPDGCATEVVANCFPAPAFECDRTAILAEILRLLRPGGTARIQTNSGFSPAGAKALRAAGFEVTGQLATLRARP